MLTEFGVRVRRTFVSPRRVGGGGTRKTTPRRRAPWGSGSDSKDTSPDRAPTQAAETAAQLPKKESE